MRKLQMSQAAAADALLALGYRAEATDRKILPTIYTKPDAESVYLYCPILDNQYTYAPGDYWYAIFGQYAPLVVYPRQMAHEPLPARAWMPRAVTSLPKLFTTRSVAEHFGVSLAHVKGLIHQHKLLVPLRGAERALSFDEEALAAWLAQRKPSGRPRSIDCELPNAKAVGLQERTKKFVENS